MKNRKRGKLKEMEPYKKVERRKMPEKQFQMIQEIRKIKLLYSPSSKNANTLCCRILFCFYISSSTFVKFSLLKDKFVIICY